MAISAKELPKNHTDKERFAAASSCIATEILTLLFARKRRRSTGPVLYQPPRSRGRRVPDLKVPIERFGEHRRFIFNHRQLSDPTPVSLHFNHAGNSINDVILIPLELIRSNRDPVRKAREDHHLIHKENTTSPLGIIRRNEVR